MSFEDRLRADLQDIPVPPLTPARGLADAALTGVRRQNRLRAVAVAGVAALAVIAAVPAVRDALPGGAVDPAGPPCGGPLPSLTPSSSWEYFDPLTYLIASEVSSFEPRTYDTASYYQVAEFMNQATQRQLTVTLYAAGAVPHYVGPGPTAPIDPAAGEPAGTVGGTPAYWLPIQPVNSDGGGQGLAWQWTPGAWVFATMTDLTSTVDNAVESTVDVYTLRDEAAALAQALQLGTPVPVTSPFSMPAPDCTRLAYTSLVRGITDDATTSQFRLGFVTEGQAEATNPLLNPGDSAPAVTVGVDTSATPDDKPGSASSEVDGHPAAVNGSQLVVYDVDGMAVEISTGPTTLDPIAVFRTVEVYPDADWGAPLVR
jgi:hypothetical protein